VGTTCRTKSISRSRNWPISPGSPPGAPLTGQDHEPEKNQTPIGGLRNLRPFSPRTFRLHRVLVKIRVPLSQIYWSAMTERVFFYELIVGESFLTSSSLPQQREGLWLKRLFGSLWKHQRAREADKRELGPFPIAETIIRQIGVQGDGRGKEPIWIDLYLRIPRGRGASSDSRWSIENSKI